MSNGFLFNAPKGINLDVSETNIETKNTCKFIKNLTQSVNVNTDGGTPQISGNNQFTRTPPLGNILICNINLPEEGESFAIGSVNDTNSKKTYIHVWNSVKKHLIYRLNEDESCEIVYSGSCLDYTLSPENFIPQNRNEVFYKKQTNLFSGVSDYTSELIFIDGKKWQRYINVNDSIATASFTKDKNGPTDKFLLSNPLNPSKTVLFDPCEYIELIPRTPLRCVTFTEVANTEKDKNNFIKDKTWQFRIKFIDVWNRESEHGVISEMYIPSSGNCQQSSIQSRCLKLKIEAGSPIVSKIQIEFRNCVNTNSNIPTTTDWYKYDVIDKYGDCGVNDKQEWYNRIITLNPYDAETNTFEYLFCADKECTPIPVDETNRTENQMPINSGAMVRIGEGIALANNIVNYPRIGCDVIDKLNVEYEPPVAGCEIQYNDIEFWAVVHNPFVNVNQFVYNKGGVRENSGFTGGAWSWGGIGSFNSVTSSVPEVSGAGTDYGQTFNGQSNNQQNFWAYLEGTDFKVQGYQQLFQGGTLKDYGGVAWDAGENKRIARGILNGDFYLQHFVFKNVPKGKYLLRIAGHNNSLDVDYQNSSTYVVGTIEKADYLLTSSIVDYNDIDTYYKELEIDTCNEPSGLFSTSTMLMICDLTCPDSAFLVNSRSNVYYGYLKDALGSSVELSPVVITNYDLQTPDTSLASDVTLTEAWTTLVNKTDHNGFWFCAVSDVGIFSGAIDLAYLVEDLICGNVKQIAFTDHMDTSNADATLIPLTVSEDPVIGVPDYSKCKKIFITGLIQDCDNKPVVNQVICFTRSKSVKTNSLGYFTLTIHNDVDANIGVPTTLGRVIDAAQYKDKIFLSQNGVCSFVDCSSCNMCVTIYYNVDINFELVCFDCDGGNTKTLTVLPTKITFPFADQRGLKHGSSVKVGLVLYDAAGRHTFVGTDDRLNISIPKEQAQLSQRFGKLKYTLTNKTFDGELSWVKYIGLWWTDQQAAYTYLSFVINSVDINTQTGKIKIGFESIINYNTDNYFKTNTTWQFLQGDRVEFIANEAGVFYNTATVGLLNFQIQGNTENNSGIIDYDAKLANLKPGTLIQLQRPKECNTELFWYEVCSPIKLDENNRIPVSQLTGYLNIWNSYLVNRKIRYSNGGVDGTYTFPFSFEHFSPSDFWGGSCGSRGRISTVNPYEQQYQKPMGVMLSDGYSTNINGLSRFDTANEFQFDDNGYGYITAMVTKLNMVLFICAKSAFVSAYDDQTLKVNDQGRVFYTGAKFSKPNPQNKELGCEVVDVSTISKMDGIVMFLDRNNGALVLHNYQSCDDVSENKFYGYLVSKLDVIGKNNSKNDPFLFNKMFVANFDNEKKEYLITQFDLPKFDENGVRTTPDTTYINTDNSPNLYVPETFSYFPSSDYPAGESMRSFYSFTQEFYSTLNDKLISLSRAKPYNHGIRNSAIFNTFNGVECRSVFEFVCLADNPELVKFFQWLEIYCKEQKWEAPVITTENGQLSLIPEDYFESIDNFLSSQFLCDINTFPDPTIPELLTADGRLLNGDILRGKWIRVKLVSSDTNKQNYFELQGVTVFAGDIQKSGTEGNPK